jgi:hypothetical protein
VPDLFVVIGPQHAVMVAVLAGGGRVGVVFRGDAGVARCAGHTAAAAAGGACRCRGVSGAPQCIGRCRGVAASLATNGSRLAD